MAVSPALLKGIAGVGAISTVSVGGIYWYTRTDTSSNNPTTTDNNKPPINFGNIDNFALDLTRTWTLTTTPANLLTSASPVNVEVVLKTTDNTTSPTKIWACKIQGTISSVQTGYTMDIEALKTALGITENSARAKDKQHNFKVFFEKCKNGRTPDSTEDSSMGVISPITISPESGSSKYKFDETELKKLYDGTNEIFKELNVSIENTNSFPTEINLTHEQFKNIKFEDKNNPSVPDNTSIKLKIEKTEDKTTYPEELKFTFINDKDIKIKQDSSGSNHIVLIADTNTEFKVKITAEGAYSLEKVWGLTDFLSKVGITSSGSDGNISYTMGEKINVYKSEESKVKDATFESSASKAITVTQGEKGYNQGIKLKVSADVTLSGVSGSSNPTKILADKSYEIGLRNTDWYLIEKDEQQVKEQLVNLKCTAQTGGETTCVAEVGKQIKVTPAFAEGQSLKREAANDNNNYPDKHKYTNSSDSKNYKIDCSGEECTLKEVSSN